MHARYIRKVVTRAVILISFFYLLYKFYQNVTAEKRSMLAGCSKIEGGKCVIKKTGLTYDKDTFFMDQKPFRILSGSFHYFRTEPQQWEDRLLKMKAAGLNTVTTYIPWNLHEPIKMQYQFRGKWNIEKFIELVDETGLYLIIRPGPYICAEWEYGGLPSWLLSDQNMVIRDSSYKPYLKHVERYFSHLLPLFVPYQYKKGGGPIIAFQIENEFGSYKKDLDYLNFVKEQYEKNGLNELFFTSDGGETLGDGSVPGTLATVNFDVKPDYNLGLLRKFQPDKPLMVGEFWDGWFDHWTEKHHTGGLDKLMEVTEEILKNKSSINWFVFAGGTNFGFWNGANNHTGSYQPTQTSYDYDAPISECGDLTPKYASIRRLLKKLQLAPGNLPDIPSNPPKAEYGVVEMKQCMSYTDMMSHIKDKITLKNPTAMEYLPIHNGGGQGYGWLLYRTTFSKGDTLKFSGPIKDRAQVILNGKLIAVIDWFKPPGDIRLKNLKDSNQLDILVENTGRVNFVYRAILKPQRRGILGQVLIDNHEVHDWEHVPFEFDPKFMRDIDSSSQWKQICNENALPSLYRGTLFVTNNPVDTFIYMKKWSKGIVFINGWNLGRYWHVGPQQTLYIPYPLLRKGENSVVIFELHKSDGSVKFVDHPVLDEDIPERNFIDNE